MAEITIWAINQAAKAVGNTNWWIKIVKYKFGKDDI